MRQALVECVPNFSEGRDPAVVDKIEFAIARVPGVAILDRTMDYDHHRSVITFAGTPDAVVSAAFRGVAAAVELIDLNFHTGVHPRLGSADVIPFVPIDGITLQQCAGLAQRLAKEIWEKLNVPSYLYGAAAHRQDRLKLENVRRGEFEGLRDLIGTNPDRRPDIGGPGLHPTAGACIVGARKFLIAYNINLRSQDVHLARRIARTIRESSGGLPHVKALGMMLANRGQAQVSMNLTDFEITPLHVVFEAVRDLAWAEGTEIAGSELIGLIPQAALDAIGGHDLQFENFHQGLILENRLSESGRMIDGRHQR